MIDGAPGPTVLDVDIAHGRTWRQALERGDPRCWSPPPMASVRTVRLATYRGDEQHNASLADAVDLRGRGGYVIALAQLRLAAGRTWASYFGQPPP